MKEREETNAQLMKELEKLRRRVAELEQAENKRKRTEEGRKDHEAESSH